MLSPIPRQLKIKHINPLKGTIIGRIVQTETTPEARPDSILLTQFLRNDSDYSGYAGILAINEINSIGHFSKLPSALGIIQSEHSLTNGDVVAIQPSGIVRVLYRPKSIHNDLFVTQRCNSRCIMCSQPPTESDDSDLLAVNLRIIELADKSTTALGITGGEPTLLKEDLLKIIAYCNHHLPHTQLHLLTNGRLLRHEVYARQLAAVAHPNVTVAVPLYSDIDSEHDYIVQARNGFEQTVLGILNLARYKIPIELRVVIHKLNFLRLPQLAEFIYRNLPFACHVALMALEPIGLAATNIQKLWIDPVEYGTQLSAATRFLAMRGINVSIYNHQLCTVPEDVRHFCRQSISDWKMAYLPSCERCFCKSSCGGFFESALPRHHSAHIKPF
jgi:His-Xaa-Ser system radical SAM maturase HxsC